MPDTQKQDGKWQFELNLICRAALGVRRCGRPSYVRAMRPLMWLELLNRGLTFNFALLYTEITAADGVCVRNHQQEMFKYHFYSLAWREGCEDFCLELKLHETKRRSRDEVMRAQREIKSAASCNMNQMTTNTSNNSKSINTTPVHS